MRSEISCGSRLGQRPLSEPPAEADLADPALLDESRTALDALTKILNLGAVYPFQID